MIMKAIAKNAVLALTVAAGVTPVPVQAHHSFAMYDTTKPYAVTGVLVRTNPDAFHYQLFIAQLDADRKGIVRDKDGKPVVWAVELEGAAQVAAMGINAKNFEPGVIVSAGFFPLRNGNPGGAGGGELGVVKCPEKTPPAAGMFCDGVEGSQSFGSSHPADIEEAKSTIAAS